MRMKRRSFASVVLGVVCALAFAVGAQAATTYTTTTSSSTTPDPPVASNPGAKMTGLGIYAGIMTPINPSNWRDYKVTESWGFYVNVPIIPHFHIMPQADMYRLIYKGKRTNEIIKSADGTTYTINRYLPPKETGVTDLSLNFKFNLPINRWNLFLAPLMGISNGGFVHNDPIHAHVGVGLGLTVNLVSVLDFMIMTQYKFMIDSSQDNVHFFHTVAGFQFNL